MVIGVIGVFRPAVVGRVAVGNPGMSIGLAVEPVASPQDMIGLSIRHRAGLRDGRSRRIRGWTYAVIIPAVPVVAPLPDVAGHIVETIAIGAAGCLVGILTARPTEVGFALQLAAIEIHRRCPWQWSGLKWVSRVGQIGLGSIDIIAIRVDIVRLFLISSG